MRVSVCFVSTVSHAYHCLLIRGRHQKLYIVIATRYVTFLRNRMMLTTLRRIVIASYSNRFGLYQSLIEIVIASYSYRSGLIGIVLLLIVIALVQEE